MRPLWKGSLSFGLVNIPIRLYTATQEKELKFVMLHNKDHSRIRYARICEAEGKEIPWKEITKGYEYQKGDYVILDEEDFKLAHGKKSDTIEIESFIDLSEIDPIFFERSYFLEPEKSSVKAYALLREALKKSDKAGLCLFMIHQRTHIGIIRAFQNTLVINQLRYLTEIVSTKSFEIKEKGKVSPSELSIAIKLIDQLTKKFNAQNYKDTYVQKLKKVIDKKKKGQRPKVKTVAKKPSAKVHDIMAQLKMSLETSKGRKKRVG